MNIEKFLKSYKTDLALLRKVDYWHGPILLEVTLLALILRKIFFTDLDEIRQSLHPSRRKDQDFDKDYGSFPIGSSDTLAQIGKRIGIERTLIDIEITQLVARLPVHPRNQVVQMIQGAETEAF